MIQKQAQIQKEEGDRLQRFRRETMALKVEILAESERLMQEFQEEEKQEPTPSSSSHLREGGERAMAARAGGK